MVGIAIVAISIFYFDNFMNGKGEGLNLYDIGQWLITLKIRIDDR